MEEGGAMNGAIAYEGTSGPYGTSSGLVMIDKILSIAQSKHYDHRVIRLSDGSSIATSTTMLELDQRINGVLQSMSGEQQNTCNVVALPEPMLGQAIRSGTKPRPLEG